MNRKFILFIEIGKVKETCNLCTGAYRVFKTDDVFRVWYVHVQNAESKIGIINIPRIVRVEELVGECFDLKEQRKILDKLYDKTMTSIQIEFYQGIKNLPDRILTEFSLWKKKLCMIL